MSVIFVRFVIYNAYYIFGFKFEFSNVTFLVVHFLEARKQWSNLKFTHHGIEAISDVSSIESIVIRFNVCHFMNISNINLEMKI